MVSIIPAQFSRCFFQLLLPTMSLELPCQYHLCSLHCGSLGQVSMSYNDTVEGVGTENEDFSSFLLVSNRVFLPRCL